MTITPARPLVIRSPEDLVTVPYMLRFHPDKDSVVVAGYGGPHGTCALRFDSARDADGVAERVADLLVQNGFRRAMPVGYGREQDVAPSSYSLTMCGIPVGSDGKSHNPTPRWSSARPARPKQAGRVVSRREDTL